MSMPVIARFTYRIRDGRFAEFRDKLRASTDPKFDSASMPTAIHFHREALPGPRADIVILDIHYESLAAFGARTAFEQHHPDWAAIWAPRDDAPEALLSLHILSPFDPFA